MNLRDELVEVVPYKIIYNLLKIDQEQYLDLLSMIKIKIQLKIDLEQYLDLLLTIKIEYIITIKIF